MLMNAWLNARGGMMQLAAYSNKVEDAGFTQQMLPLQVGRLNTNALFFQVRLIRMISKFTFFS